MIKIIDDETAILEKQKLEESLSLDPTFDSSKLSSMDINWVEGNYRDFEDIKIKARELMSLENNERNLFLCHSNDRIIGKPQLVHPSMKTIVLLKKVLKVEKDKEGNDRNYISSWKFLDEHYDKRYDGNLQWEMKSDFWIYRINYNNRDYYIFSKHQLEMKNYEMTGMVVELNDKTEMTNNLKLKSISKVFFLKDFEPTVKVLDKESLIELTKDLEITPDVWFNLVNAHPLNTINNFPESTNLIRTAQMLSGKMDGWPMHLAVMGKPGTRKSFGYIETTAFKFDEAMEIVEGANSRIKCLSPSFKEKPANIGYLAKSERMGFIDELGKMVEFEINKHQSAITNVLGELNFLLDWKKRTVGSGNDNDCVVQANAKFLFASNGVKGKDYLGNHVGLIDPTTMSRIVWWIQDEEEINLVLSEKGITRVPPTPTQALDNIKIKRVKNFGLSKGGLGYVWGENFTHKTISRDHFLTIFDSCNSFLCQVDLIEVQKLVRETTLMAKDPMKSVWKPRAEHHIYLLIDGLCKFRCLFEDYDHSFTPNKKDYERAEALLIKMVKAWSCCVSIKNNEVFG